MQRTQSFCLILTELGEEPVIYISYLSHLKSHITFDPDTGFLSEIGTKLRDWAIGQAGAGCYSQAALSSNDSKTR